MRALRVVGVTGDGSVVLEDPGRRERYTVPADEQLRAAARGDVTRLGQIAIELESQLRPREIQARIRGGASVAEVAEAAGVPVQKIERFAYPVLLERSRTAELAQGAHPQRADGPDVRTLGETVAHTFGLRGQDYSVADWDSWKGDDGKWVVALSWRAGRSDNAAHWTFQPGANGGIVQALDEHASDLVEGLPVRPLRTVGPVIEIARDDIARDDEAGPDEPESPQARAVAGQARAAETRRRIAPEQRRSSPTPPWGGGAGSPAEPPAASPDEPPATAPTEPTHDGSLSARSTAGNSPGSHSPTSGSATTDPAATGPAVTNGYGTNGSAPAGPETDGSAPTGFETDGSAPTGSAPTGSATAEAPTTGSATSGSETTGSATTGSAPAGSTPAGSGTDGSATTGSAATGSAAAGTGPTGAAMTGSAAEATATSAAAGSGSPGSPAGTPAASEVGAPAGAGAAAPAHGAEPAAPERAADVVEETEQDVTHRGQPETGDPSEADEPGRARTAGGRGGAANRRTKKGKPVMPSWDEVLLGVRGQR